MWISESKPVCSTNNGTLDGNAFDVTDHIEINCSVRYSGLWTPVFVCADGLPGDTSNESSSNHVTYRRIIAASDIEDSTVLNCSIDDFTLNYRTNLSQPPVELQQKPTFHFVWNTSEIRVVNASGNYTNMNEMVCLNFTFHQNWRRLSDLRCQWWSKIIFHISSVIGCTVAQEVIFNAWKCDMHRNHMQFFIIC